MRLGLRLSLLACAAVIACERDVAPARVKRTLAPAGNMRGLVDWKAHRTSSAASSLVEVLELVGVFRADPPRPLELSASERRFAGAVAQAMQELEPITWDQRGPHNLAVRELVAGLLAAPPELFEAHDRERLQSYAKRLYLGRGIYDPFSYKKLVPELPASVVEKMLAEAVRRGLKLRRFAINDQASLEKRWPEIRKIVWDPKEAPQRGGADNLGPALYPAELGRARAQLRAAQEAMPERRAELLAIDEALRSGEPEAWRRALSFDERAHLVVMVGPVDPEPRGKKRELGGLLLLRDEHFSAEAERLSRLAPELEAKLSIEGRYRRGPEAPHPVVAGSVLASFGSLGARLPPGLLAPEESGKVAILLPPLTETVESSSPRYFDAFGYDPADYADNVRCARSAWIGQALLTEAVGRNVGKTVVPDWRSLLAEHADTLERARLDLVALSLIGDPEALEATGVMDERCAELMPLAYASRLRLALAPLPEGRRIEDPELRAQNLIVQYALARGGLELVKSGGALYFAAGEPGRLRAAISTLLGELVRIKAEGDHDAAQQLIGQYGTRIPRDWREDGRRRLEATGAAALALYLVPRWQNGADGPEPSRLGLLETFLFDAARDRLGAP
ncbi:MAG: hypothetical protein U1E65_23790 [Myxococcota bacterium]